MEEQENEKDYRMKEAGFLIDLSKFSIRCGQPRRDDTRGSLCGKMFPVLSPAMAGVTFRVCSGKSAKPILQYLRPADGGGCGMVRTEHCDIAWRVLDAQFWGVPQRRKRIFLVADFAEKGRCADKILFVG